MINKNLFPRICYRVVEFCYAQKSERQNKRERNFVDYQRKQQNKIPLQAQMIKEKER